MIQMLADVIHLVKVGSAVRWMIGRDTGVSVLRKMRATTSESDHVKVLQLTTSYKFEA